MDKNIASGFVKYSRLSMNDFTSLIFNKSLSRIELNVLLVSKYEKLIPDFNLPFLFKRALLIMSDNILS